MDEDIKKAIEQELEDLEDPWAAYLETPAEASHKASMAAVDLMAAEERDIIMIAANRPASTIMKECDRFGIDQKNLFIIDCVSKSQESSQPDKDNVLFIENASSLTDISISLNEIIERRKENGAKPVVVLDSINALLIHNDARTVTRFTHSLLTKLRLHDVSGILLGVEDDIDSTTRSQIIQLSDTVVSV